MIPLHSRLLVISALLFSSIALEAQNNYGGTYLKPIWSIQDPTVISLTKPENLIDSADYSNHLIQVHKHNKYISSKEMLFYENLRKIAQEKYVTRWVHELIVRKQLPANQQIRNIRNSEIEYTDYEGLTIKDISYTSTGLLAPSIDEMVYHTPGGLERITSFFHVNTRERVIENNILFKRGDRIDPYILSDNERILRQLSYLEDARIYVVEDKFNPGYADIIVHTKDRWSKGFDADINDIDEGVLELYDRNVFGFGQGLQANLLFDGGDDNIIGYEAKLSINNLGGRFINSGLFYHDAFGNNTFRIHTGRNFLNPSMKYAGGIDFTSSSLVGDYIFYDTSFIDQHLNYHEYDYWFGRSFLLPGNRSAARRNIFITTRFNRNVFFERPDISEQSRHIFHNRNIFLLNLTVTRVRYLKSNYIYGFGPTEDIPVGTRMEITAGYEENQFFKRWYGGGLISQSNYLINRAYLNNSIMVGGFLNNGAREQGVLKLQTNGFSSLVHMNRFYLRQFLSVNYTRGIKRFDDESISISNREGIRGLRSDKLAGTEKLTIQAETMFYGKRNWYGFRYAFFVMADLGWIGNENRSLMKDDLYSGFGLGMRFRNEHLVLPTLQFRFAFFPRIPDSASTSIFYLMSRRNPAFDNFTVKAPEILPYR